MNEVFKDVLTDKRKLFVVLMIVVPFIVYSGNYYVHIFKNAPYRGDQFEYVELKKYRNGLLREYINTRTGEYTYYNGKDSLVHQHINLSAKQLHVLHTTFMDVIYWDIEPVNGDTTMQHRKEVPIYMVNAVYQRKSKKVWWQTHYYEDPKLDERMGEVVRSIEAGATEGIEKTNK